ncbi:MAG: DUF4956 domain-containing protein [Spirochaetaceae bacterium]|nr:DUF4956 domain-containing protein [Spirochaetaceae bacterium]
MNIEFLGEQFLNPQSFLFLLFRFFLDLAVISIMIVGIYHKLNKKSGYMFVLYIFNILVFFVASVLSLVQLNTGFAFGLFAVFSILRYRTRQIPIREMTFLFIAIIVAIINSTVTANISLMEILFANVVILAVCSFASRVWANAYLRSQKITYEKIELIVPEKREELIEDLKMRTGLPVVSVEIDRINFLRDTARIVVFYNQEDVKGEF